MDHALAGVHHCPVIHGPGRVALTRLTGDVRALIELRETMRHLRLAMLAASTMIIVVPWLKADSVRLRDGKSLEGTFVGGSARQLEILTVSGQTVKLPIQSVHSVTFSAPPAEPAQTPATGMARGAVLVPSGTSLRVRTLDPIDVDSSRAGAKFRGRPMTRSC